MVWIKRGLVFRPSGADWARSHASNPVVLPLDGGRYRVYFASRDDAQRSHVGFVEYDAAEPERPLRASEQPVIAPGPLGHFDDHGVYAMSLVEHDGRTLMYYVGWNPGRPPLYYTSIGLAVSDDGGETFTRASRAPIMARSDVDPWMVSSPCVLLEEGRWRMWYLSGLGLEEVAGVLRSRYHIKYAESDDGVHWRRDGRVALELREGETNIARACVRRRAGDYEAWYSVNGGAGYRIGCAQSPDGLAWERHDERAGIELSTKGWDSEALAYPWVFEHGGRRLMLYNGNGFGRDGFGLAEWRA
jgi:predicted GH43/DUF377 family glycosyl hydrolase